MNAKTANEATLELIARRAVIFPIIEEGYMGQFAGTTFGIGTPTIYSVPQNPFIGGYGSTPYGAGVVPPLQQIAQLAQIIPQQLQQLQLLQQQQLLLVQQLAQQVPAQLQQLQQLIPIGSHQLQQPWQQSFGASPFGFGLAPQPFAGQTTSHVM